MPLYRAHAAATVIRPPLLNMGLKMLSTSRRRNSRTLHRPYILASHHPASRIADYLTTVVSVLFTRPPVAYPGKPRETQAIAPLLLRGRRRLRVGMKGPLALSAANGEAAVGV